MHRANSLCDDKFINNEFSHIDKALKQNGYPQKMISNISRKLLQNETATNTGPNNSKYISAPYIHGTSERVARVLIRHNIHLAHKRESKELNSPLRDDISYVCRAYTMYWLDG